MKEHAKQSYMSVARIFAKHSYAKKLQVGSVIVKDDRIISIGYNGTPAGWSNVCEDVVDGILITRDEVLHAEANAIAKLARSNEAGLGSSIFVTHAPCMSCAKTIYQTGIESVYYDKEYRNTKGIDFLKKCGIYVENLNGS
jgi:dCMP deaminase